MLTNVKPKKKTTSYIWALFYYFVLFLLVYGISRKPVTGFDLIFFSILILCFIFVAYLQAAKVFFEKLELYDGKIKYYNVIKFQKFEMSSYNIENIDVVSHHIHGIPFKILEIKYYHNNKPLKKIFQIYIIHDMEYLANGFKNGMDKNTKEITIK